MSIMIFHWNIVILKNLLKKNRHFILIISQIVVWFCIIQIYFMWLISIQDIYVCVVLYDSFDIHKELINYNVGYFLLLERTENVIFIMFIINIPLEALMIVSLTISVQKLSLHYLCINFPTLDDATS